MSYRYLLIIFLLFAVNRSQGQESSLMANVDNAFLDKLIAAAKANYPKVKAQDVHVNIANIAVNKAKLDWLSIVSFTYLYSPNNSTTALVNPSLLNGYQFGFSTTIGGILQRPGAVKTAKQELRLAELSREEYDLSVTAQVKQRYYAYVTLQSVLNWRLKSLETAEATLKEMKYKFEKGLETFENYNRAQTFVSTSTQSKIETEGSLLLAKTNLEEIIGTKLESIQ